MNGRPNMGIEDIKRFPSGCPLNVMLPHHTGVKRKIDNLDNTPTIELHQETRAVWWTCTFPNCRWKNHTIYINNETTNKRRNSMKQAHSARHKRHNHQFEIEGSLNLNQIRNPRRTRLVGKQKPPLKVIVRTRIKNK